MTLTLLREEPANAEAIYFVIQRRNGHWSPDAKIVSVFSNENIAEVFAANQKKLHPQQMFGVAVLRSEARQVPDTVEIVHMETR